MGPRTAKPLTRLALAAFVLLMAGAAWGDDESFICGSSDDEGGALAKGADLPKITKVYSGTSIALVVRIRYQDSAYRTTDSALAKTHATVNAHYLSMSRNTFKFEFRIHPEVWTAPLSKREYDSNFTALRNFITTKIKEAGYVKSSTPGEKNYTVFVASFPNIRVGWSGLSSGPSSGGNYINGSYGAGVTGHELGHAVGLPHAHAIEPCPSNHSCEATDIFGTPGDKAQHIEYGNPYDIMGGGGSNGHFNVNFKWRTGWMDADEMLEVKNTGVYRIYGSDNAVHKGRLLGVRIPSTDTRYAYWVEYRPENTNARAGAAVMFEGFNGTNSRSIHILDATPQSRTSSDARDATLVPGKEIKDKYGIMTLKTVAINTNVWDANGWVDLQVTIPGTPILALRPGNVLRLVDREVPAFDLTGRRIAEPASLLQASFLPAKNGRARLALQR